MAVKLSGKYYLRVAGLFASILFIYALNKTNEISKVSNKFHFQFDIPLWIHDETCADADDRSVCTECQRKPELWDCVGEDHNWSMVFVDNRPAEMRDPNMQRMVLRTEVLVSHDSDLVSHDSDDSNGTGYGMEGRWKWDGRKVFTSLGELTSIIQGDLDKTGAVFDKVVSLFNSGDTIPYAEKYNPTNSGWGTHIRLLTAAALVTRGDILEMGTGFFSTTVLHQIVEEQGGARMILSADTDIAWLSLFRNLSTPFHQMLLVPVYEDIASCGDYQANRLPVMPLKEMEFAGTIERELTTNRNIACPKRGKNNLV